MSWLFGIKGNQPVPEAPQFGLPPPPSGGDDGNKGNSDDAQGQKSKMEAYRFDSAALERAAKAAKDLEKSSTYKTFLYFMLVFYLMFCVEILTDKIAIADSHAMSFTRSAWLYSNT